MKDLLIPILLLSLSAFAAYILFFKKPTTDSKKITVAPTGYAYGAPVQPYDVVGPTYAQANMVEFPRIGVVV